jgi:hypothetical protein
MAEQRRRTKAPASHVAGVSCPFAKPFVNTTQTRRRKRTVETKQKLLSEKTTSMLLLLGTLLLCLSSYASIQATRARNAASAVTISSAEDPHIAYQPDPLVDQRLVDRLSPTPKSPHKKIPNILIFTHAVNLLLFKNTTTNMTFDSKTTKELRVLQQNVRRSVRHHPGARVRFLTDHDCADSIRSVIQPDERADRLVHYFYREKQGMYKADLCRGAALYETGGVYLDVDLGVRMNVFGALANETEFATVLVHAASNWPGAFFQAFIAVSPQHELMRRYAELFLDYYDGKLPQFDGEPLGVVLLRKAYDERNNTKNVELWQEVFYHSEYRKTIFKHVPYPTWGVRRACKFVVVTDKTKKPLVVPFYSRVGGSRMCPIKV